MTKEDILEKAEGDVIEYPHYALNSFQQQTCFNAMDLWAKQEAIGFENWKKSKGVMWNANVGYVTKAEELFDTYKSEKNENGKNNSTV